MPENVDVEETHISTTLKAAFVAICGVAVFTWYVSGYATEVERMKIHLIEHPKIMAKYDKIIFSQMLLNRTLEIKLKAEEENRKRLEKRFDKLILQLERLQLVTKSTDTNNHKNKKGNYAENTKAREDFYY